MLKDHPVEVILLATDLAASRDFYATKLGLEVESENDETVTFRCGGNTRLSLSASTTGTSDEQTQAVWQVTDIRAEVAELRARGVEIMEYDTDEMKTEDGVADMGEVGKAGGRRRVADQRQERNHRGDADDFEQPRAGEAQGDQREPAPVAQPPRAPRPGASRW